MAALSALQKPESSTPSDDSPARRGKVIFFPEFVYRLGEDTFDELAIVSVPGTKYAVFVSHRPKSCDTPFNALVAVSLLDGHSNLELIRRAFPQFQITHSKETGIISNGLESLPVQILFAIYCDELKEREFGA